MHKISIWPLPSRSILWVLHQPPLRTIATSTDGGDASFLTKLKHCTREKDLRAGIKVHADILQRGLLDKNPYVASALINMYAKCGELPKAQGVMVQLSLRDVVSWNALIAGYAQQGQGQEALNCFAQMRNEGFYPDAVTYTCVLKACGIVGAIDKGIQIHDDIVHTGLLEKDVVLGTALVDMYARCGVLVRAQEVLEKLPVRNVVSWSALIAGYAQHGQCDDAFSCFQRMKSEGLCPNMVTFLSILKACGISGATEKGKLVHDEIVRRGLLQNNIVLGNALVDMYSKCGELAKAREVLEELPARNVVSWSALIAGYVEQGQGHEAIICLEQMQREGLSPNAVTLICILKACGSTKSIDKGRQIHHYIARRGMLKKDIMLATALVDMYAKCGLLSSAKRILKDLSVRDIVSWNAIIAGYADQGQYDEALDSFEHMQSEGLCPDEVTFICILKACANTGAIKAGKHIHQEIVNRGLLKDIVLGNTLLDMYAKCGMLAKAEDVLEELPVRDVISWSVVISGYMQQELGHEALDCFDRMQSEGVSPNLVTFLCILQACGNIGAVDRGKQIHDDVMSRNLLEKDVALGNALVNMYAKCGALVKAHELLEVIPTRNVVSWNGLISGYAQQGHFDEALNCLERMQHEDIAPDEVTFLCVLSACCHAGLFDEAQDLFGNMIGKYNISPSFEHYICLVVVFGAVGNFDRAIAVIKVMPSCDHPEIWVALLGSCRKWGNLKLGRAAFDQAVQLDSSCSVPYVIIANIFAAVGMQEDAEKVEAMRLKYATRKKPGKRVRADESTYVSSFCLRPEIVEMLKDEYWT